MLTGPREGLPRHSTYTVRTDGPGYLDLTTVQESDSHDAWDGYVVPWDGSVLISPGDSARTVLHTKAIFTIRAGVLTYCIAAPGYARPTAFATSAADGRTLVVLKRIGDVAHH